MTHFESLEQLPAERPRPIADAAKGWGALVTAGGTVISALAAFGAVTLEQSEALQTVLGVAAPMAAAVTGLLVAFGIVRRAEPHTTPLADPRNDAGHQLVAES